jgi:hypothetical protein
MARENGSGVCHVPLRAGTTGARHPVHRGHTRQARQMNGSARFRNRRCGAWPAWAVAKGKRRCSLCREVRPRCISGELPPEGPPQDPESMFGKRAKLSSAISARNVLALVSCSPRTTSWSARHIPQLPFVCLGASCQAPSSPSCIQQIHTGEERSFASVKAAGFQLRPPLRAEAENRIKRPGAASLPFTGLFDTCGIVWCREFPGRALTLSRVDLVRITKAGERLVDVCRPSCRRLAFAIATVARGASITLSGSRSLWPALVLVPPSFRRLITTAAPLVVLVLIAASGFIGLRLEEALDDLRAAASGEFHTSLGQRFVMWQIGVELITDAPFFGHGPGAETLLMEARSQDIGDSPSHTCIFTTPSSQFAVRDDIFGVIAICALRLTPPLTAAHARQDEAGTYGLALSQACSVPVSSVECSASCLATTSWTHFRHIDDDRPLPCLRTG